MKDILEIVKTLEDSELLLNGVSETIKNETRKPKGGSLSMLLGTLGASLLGNMLAGKRVVGAGEGTARVGYGSEGSSIKRSSSKKILIPPHPLTNFEIQMYYQNEPRLMVFILEIICLIK